MFTLAKDGDTIRQVVIHNELKEKMESIGFVDSVDKIQDPMIEDAVIVEEKPKKKRAPRKAKVDKDA